MMQPDPSPRRRSGMNAREGFGVLLRAGEAPARLRIPEPVPMIDIVHPPARWAGTCLLLLLAAAACRSDDGEAGAAQRGGGGPRGPGGAGGAGRGARDAPTPVEVGVVARGALARTTMVSGALEPIRAVGVNALLA